MSQQARDFGWLLTNFVTETDGVHAVIAVSADGILLAASDTVGRSAAEQFAAVTCGMASLGSGAARLFELGGVEQIMIETSGGYVFSTAIGLGSAIGVVAAKDCDIGAVAYAMTVLVNRAGGVLTPQVLDELKNALVT